MLKFDEMNASEDATDPSEMVSVNCSNSKPSEEALHPTEGTRYNVLSRDPVDSAQIVRRPGKSRAL
jgi:hypothetical protein